MSFLSSSAFILGTQFYSAPWPYCAVTVKVRRGRFAALGYVSRTHQSNACPATFERVPHRPPPVLTIPVCSSVTGVLRTFEVCPMDSLCHFARQIMIWARLFQVSWRHMGWGCPRDPFRLTLCETITWLSHARQMEGVPGTSFQVSLGYPTQGLYSPSGKTSYRQISWNLEAARLSVIMLVSHWNLTGISAALLPRCLSNCRAIEKV